MAALDEGAGCDGLVFAIDEPHVEAETFWLFARERIVPAYTPEFIPVETAHGTVTALTFVADHAAEMIAPGMTRDETVRYLATGAGFLGSSLDYLRNLLRQLDALGIDDLELSALLGDGEAFAASR
jgi:cation transport protein ChaC